MFRLQNKKNVPQPDRTDVVPGRNCIRNGFGTISTKWYFLWITIFCSVTSCVVAWYNYLTYLPQNLLKCFLVVQLICGCTQTWIMIGRRKVTSFLKLLRIFCCTFKKASPTRICMRSKMHMKMGNYLLVLPFVCLYVLCIISCFFLSLLMNNRSFLKVCCKFWPTISLQKGRLNFANVLIWFENLCMETVCVHIF